VKRGWILILGVLGLMATTVGAAPWQGFASMGLSPDGSSLVTGGREGEVLWIDVATGEVRDRWVWGRGPVVAELFLGDGSSVGVAGLDGSLGLFSRGHPEPQTAPAPGDQTALLREAVARWRAGSPVTQGLRVTLGSRWAEGSPDGRISVGDGTREAPLVTWTAHTSAVMGLAFTPDGSRLVSCSYDGTLALWDPKTGQALGLLSPHDR